jgi:hypothetical protein
LGRTLFQQGVEKGFYARVSRLEEQWFELDLHFLSLGGGEIALGYWFEEGLVPYLENTEKLKNVNSISIVTGYGKTRTRGRRHGDDGMRKRVKAMLNFMNIKEIDQSNAGRIHVDKEALIAEASRNGGKISFDIEGYNQWKEKETTANVIPDVPQKVRARFKPVKLGSGRPPFVRIETEMTSPEYRLENMKNQDPLLHGFADDHRFEHDDRRPPSRERDHHHPHGDSHRDDHKRDRDLGPDSFARGRRDDGYHQERHHNGDHGRDYHYDQRHVKRSRYDDNRDRSPRGGDRSYNRHDRGSGGGYNHYGPSESRSNDSHPTRDFELRGRDDRDHFYKRGEGGGDRDRYAGRDESGGHRGEEKPEYDQRGQPNRGYKL